MLKPRLSFFSKKRKSLKGKFHARTRKYRAGGTRNNREPSTFRASHRRTRRRRTRFSGEYPTSSVIPYIYKNYVPLRIERTQYSVFNIATRLPKLLEELAFYWLQDARPIQPNKATYAQAGPQANSLFLSLYNTAQNDLNSSKHIHIFAVPNENITGRGLIISFKNKEDGHKETRFLSADWGSNNNIPQLINRMRTILLSN